MRIAIYNRDGSYVGDIDEREVVSAVTHEELNGEHSLTLVTTQVIEKGVRLLVLHSTQRTSEYAVVGIDAEHACGKKTVGTYYCVWSIQEDLSSVLVSLMPGVRTPVTGRAALIALLSTQTRWTVGSDWMTGLGGASMYDMTAWDAIGVLLDNWGGELDVQIDIVSDRITGRKVMYDERQGSDIPIPRLGGTPRIDFGEGVSSIKRTLTDSPLICRISPRGKGEETEGGGYGRKIRITSVNDGKDYLEYAPMVDVARITNSDGTYIYPTAIVENPDCETPEDLLVWAQANLAAFCTPEAVYEVDMAYFPYRDFGILELGDGVQVVDSSFAEEPLYLESRVIAIDRDLLNPRGTVYTIGAMKESIAAKFSALSGAVASAIGGVEPASTSNMNIAHYTNTNICTVSLPAGIWIITGRIRFEPNATGVRTAKISTTSADTDSVISTTMMPAFSGGSWTHVTAVRCLSLAAQTTVYLVGWQNSGSTIVCNGEMECTKVG